MLFKKFFAVLSIITFTIMGITKLQTEALSPTKTIDITNKNITYTGGSHNNVIIIRNNKKNLYFKEAKIKLNLKKTVERSINEFFDITSEEENTALLKDSIIKSLKNKKNFKKFISMGNSTNKKSTLCKFLHDQISINDLGLEIKNCESSKDLVKNLLKYVSRDISQYKMNDIKKEGELQDIPIKNELATIELAKELELHNLFANVEFVKLINKNGNEKLGIIIEEATGVRPYRLTKITKESISPQLQVELNNLEIFDFICRQTDHCPWNYNISFDSKHKLSGIKVFDNDNSFDLSTNLKEGFWHSDSPLITSDNYINLPHISKNLTNKILNFSPENLNKNLSDLLKQDQIDALIKRIEIIKRSIIITQQKNKNFILSENEYSDKTISEELNGKYGITYLKYLYNLIS